MARGGQLHLRAQLEGEHVAIEGDQVHQRQVVGVAFDPGGPALLLLFEVLERTGGAADGLGHALAGGALAEGGLEVGLLLLIQRARGLLGLGLGELVEPGGRRHARAQAVEAGGDRQHLVAPLAGGRVGGQGAGALQVAGRGPGRLGRGAGAMPSRRTSASTTASVPGVRRVTRRQRERIVTSRSSAVGVHSSHTVRGEGSSTAFSSALEAASVARSASSNSTIRNRPPVGREAERSTRSRVLSMPKLSPLGRT